MSVKAVVFDMDGVIFDTESLALECWLKVGERHGLENVRHYAMVCIGRSTKDSTEILKRAYPDEDIGSLWVECSAEYSKRIENGGLRLKKGARELLEWLTDNGVKTAVASSSAYDGVKDHLDRTGLTGYFDRIIGGDMVENSKPEPEIYLKACEMLGVPPDQAYAIEDSNNGIISAYRAGMIPLLVPDIVKNTDEVRAMAHREFKDLFEVRDHFEDL